MNKQYLNIRVEFADTKGYTVITQIEDQPESWSWCKDWGLVCDTIDGLMEQLSE